MKRPRFHDLPLFAKFLLPFLALVIVLGALGTFLIVRDLSARAQAELDDTLTRSSLDTRSILRDRELSLVESANFSANLAGLAQAMAAGDAAEATRLLRSVIALKQDLDLLVVATPDGDAFVSFLPRRSGAEPVPATGGWMESPFVAEALIHPQGAKFAGLVSSGDTTYLAVAGAVCSDADGCGSRGVVVVGLDVAEVVASLVPEGGDGHAVALFDAHGTLLSSIGRIPAEAPARPASGALRHITSIGGAETAALYTDWTMRGQRIGTLAVATPTGSTFEGVHGAGMRLAVLVLAGMAGIIGAGVLISRLTTSRVQELLETNRALGRGELSARAPVVGNDELGELARGVNQMAEELEASRETLELRVRQRTEEVERLLRERSEIFASLSHELRTPLVTILRQAEMMLDSTMASDQAASNESGAMIRDSAQQLLALVNDILELARAEVGKLDVRLEAVDVGSLLDDLQPTVEGLARSGGLRLSVDVPDAVPAVRADRRRLREIVLNLVDNAAKYTPAGGTVSVAVTASDDHVRVAVADSGVGIPAEAGERIFEPFYRVRGTTTQHGQASSGLGLAITKRLVELQGGTISFTSEPGAGTTFVVTMPAAVAESRPSTASSRRRSRRRTVASGRR